MKFILTLHFRQFFRENNRKPGFNGFLTWFNLADEVEELKRPKVVFLTKINGTRFESAPFVSAWAPKERLWILFGQSTADSASLGRCQHQPRITAQFHPFFKLKAHFSVSILNFREKFGVVPWFWAENASEKLDFKVTWLPPELYWTHKTHLTKLGLTQLSFGTHFIIYPTSRKSLDLLP